MPTIDRGVLTFLVNALWQVPVVAGATFAACRIMGSAPARYRYSVCVVGLVAALLLPIAGTRRPAERPAMAVVQQAPAASGAAVAGSSAKPATAPARTLPVPQSAADIAPWAAGLFLLYGLARLAWAGVRTFRVCRTATPNTRPCAAWDRCRNSFGLTTAELRWSRTVDGPVAAGRMVILPESMSDAPPEILEAAMAHEAAHLARRDFASGIACRLIALPISFHPATAWLLRQIARTREEACDELVTARLVERDVYARSLVRIAAAISGLGQPGYTLGVLDGDHLEERIRRLVTPRAGSVKRARLLIGAALATLAVFIAIASSLALSARAQTPAQVEMRAAADAYNNGQFEDSARFFEKAVALEPANLNARLFLANTYLRLRITDRAAEQYREVLRRDPRNTIAISGVVSLNGLERAAESHELLLRAIETDPKDKHAYYSLGVVDWGIAYRALAAANGGPGPDMYRQIGDPALRTRIRNEAGPAIEEGFRMLQVAIGLDPGWSAPMAYMNLMARVKSALADDPAESARLIGQADEWVGKAIQARKARPETQSAVRIDADGPPPAAIPAVIPPPPPPPPPPGGYRGNGDRQMPPAPPPPPPPAK